MRGNFRTRADSRTGNGAERNGGRKNCKIIRNWYLLFSTYQILYSFCKMLYNITPVVKYRRFYLLKFPSAALVYALLRSVLNRCPPDIQHHQSLQHSLQLITAGVIVWSGTLPLRKVCVNNSKKHLAKRFMVEGTE